MLVISLVMGVESSNYRHISLTSTDLCLPSLNNNLYNKFSPKLNTIQLDEGSAAVITIQANNGRVPFSKCDLKLQSEGGYGLMVKVETGMLRENSAREGKCTDYLQFGVDDNTPFITWNKSDKLCGDFTGYHYKDDAGELLLWLRLGEWDNLDTKESVHLSLVVTQYKTHQSSSRFKYRGCHTRQQWISPQYFCDGRVNCAADVIPADEDEAVCQGNNDASGHPSDTSSNLPSGPPLNLLSITLILVSVAVCLFLLCLLIVRLKINTCFTSHTHVSTHSSSCELPEASHGSRATNVTANSQPQSIVYLDLSSRSLMRGTTPEDTEPPPAYNDLFPLGYKYLLKSEETSELETVNETRLVVTEESEHTKEITPNQATSEGHNHHIEMDVNK